MKGKLPLSRAVAGAPVTNRLLDRLPAKDRDRVFSSCEEVDLSFGEILAEPGEPIRNVYFPTGSAISMMVPMGGKDLLEVAIVGSEGVYDVSVAMGISTSP